MNAVTAAEEGKTPRASRDIATQLRLSETRVFDIIPDDQYDPYY
jgi:hypothetical protein